MSDIYTIPQLSKTLLPLFRAYGIRRAILFGSYGKGTATSKSDVDLLVDSGLHGLHFVGFQNELQHALSKEVDLLDISHINTDSPIAREISQTGVIIYEE